jgi:hypothetical protein
MLLVPTHWKDKSGGGSIAPCSKPVSCVGLLRSIYSGHTHGRASATPFAVTCPCFPPKWAIV